MQVRDLIAELQKHDQYATVMVTDNSGHIGDVLGLASIAGRHTVKIAVGDMPPNGVELEDACEESRDKGWVDGYEDFRKDAIEALGEDEEAIAIINNLETSHALLT